MNEPTISVEAVAFEALKRLAQNIYEQHGVILTSAHFSWIDGSTTRGGLPTAAGMSINEVEASMRKL